MVNVPRTKMLSATFTEEEYAAIERAAKLTDRTPAAFIRWSTIKYLRELTLLPAPNDSPEDYEDE